jgi:hypothetical protein
MRKKFIFLAVGLLAGHYIFASSAYVGGTIGISSTQIDKNLTYPLYTSSLTTHQFDSNYKGFHGQIFLGKTFTFSRMQFAIQGDFDGFTNTSKDSLSNYFLGVPALVKERLDYDFGIFLLPQINLNEQVSIFSGPGIVTGHFVTTSGYTGGTLGATGNYSAWLTGWSIKLGMVNRIKNNWDLLFTYQFNQYNGATYTSLEPLSAELLQANYRPNVSLFSLGARYLFDSKMPLSNK